MKFSYQWLKSLAAKTPPERKLAEILNRHSFETANLGPGVLDINVPPNRFSDAASHSGMAREIAAVAGGRVRPLAAGEVKFELKTGDYIGVSLKDRTCPLYLALYADGVKIKPSPLWLKKRLTACGLKPVNNVVDVMNYVMLEVGQPLHAFDCEKIDGKKITVRPAREGEKITVLDGGVCNLNRDVLVIADRSSPLAIAGIKGGRRAEIGRTTKKIVVEAASFRAPSIYRTSRKLNLRTEAAARFSHGLHPALAEIAILRAAYWLKKVKAAGRFGDILVAGRKPAKRKRELKIEILKLNRFLGTAFGAKGMASVLKRLGFGVRKAGADRLKLEIPQVRTDVSSPEDIAEEVARVFGYGRIPAKMPAVAAGVKSDEIFAVKRRLRAILAAVGFSEVYNYSFVSKSDLDGSSFRAGESLEIANPVSSQFAYFRPTLILGLEKNILDNFRFFEEVRVFEIGRVFSPGIKSEKPAAAFGFGKRAARAEDLFFEVKGVLEAVLKEFGLPPLELEVFGKGEFRATSGGEVLGRLEIKNSAAVAEIDLSALRAAVPPHCFKPFPKFPSITRDISFIAGKKIKIGEVAEAVNGLKLNYFEGVEFIDCYEAERFGRDKKSLTFRVTFRSGGKTLTDDEVNGEMAKLAAFLKRKFSVEIR